VVGPGNGHDDAFVVAQVQGQVADAVLGGEAGAAEGRRVEVAVEASAFGVLDGEVRLAGTTADAVVRRLPEG